MSDAARSEAYRRRIYQDYSASIDPRLYAGAEDLEIQHPGFAHWVLPHLPPGKTSHIFDAGCGQGSFLLFLSKHGYANATGVDRSPEVVKRAKERGVPGIQQGDLYEHLAANPGRYDCVVALDLLEHLHKDEVLAFLDAAYKALKPGGSVVVQTVNADSPFFGRVLYVDLTHETAFTRYSLHQAFAAARFADSEFFPMAPWQTWRRRMIWRLIRFAAGLYYHAETGSGILHNDHLLTLTFIAKARKPLAK